MPAEPQTSSSGAAAIPAFLPCHPKDAHTLRLAVAALREHPQVSSITVVAAAVMREDCDRLGVRFQDENEILKPWFSADEAFGDRHSYYQQLLKLGLAYTAARDEEHYLVIDADTVLLRPFPLIDEATGAVLHPKMTERVLPYYAGMRELLGLEAEFIGSFVGHLMVFRPALVRELVQACAIHAGRPPDEGMDALRSFLERCDRRTLSFSEYETYGYFVHEHHPGEIRWASRRQVNVLYVEPDERVLDRLRPHYDYASFHAYRRPGRLWLRGAGAAWLASRLARDRLGARRRDPLAYPDA